ncbi:MAG: hypothetical protein CBE47_01825 [Pelagibacteraceae bacterium TMED287]|nr:MAG: hypothetical protein CBE47_01825 [Pelagibacteraceae bacterium TMED287]
MIWEYGNYKFNSNLKPPTWKKFHAWKKDFFNLKNTHKYDVWLTGGFLEDWKTLDVDIVLTGKANYEELQELMIKGISIGIEKYNMFVDIQHSDKKPELDGRKVQKIVSANKIVQDGRLITDWTDGEKIIDNLYRRFTEYPKQKQLNRNYKNKPILIKGES